jgi:hypothetical protein
MSLFPLKQKEYSADYINEVMAHKPFTKYKNYCLFSDTIGINLRCILLLPNRRLSQVWFIDENYGLWYRSCNTKSYEVNHCYLFEYKVYFNNERWMLEDRVFGNTGRSLDNWDLILKIGKN